MSTKKKRPVAPLPPEKVERAVEVIRSAVERFKGTTDELEAAIGMYMLGHYLGWKVLVLMHSKRTIRKYEEILDIVVREEFAEEGSESHRSVAYKIAINVSNFWKAVSGEDKTIAKDERKQLA